MNMNILPERQLRRVLEPHSVATVGETCNFYNAVLGGKSFISDDLFQDFRAISP